MSVPGPGVEVMEDIGLNKHSTVWPPGSGGAILATTTATTKNCAEASSTPTVLISSSPNTMSRQDWTFLLLYAQAVPLVLLGTITVVSNLMVLLMFRVKRSLRSCKNMYLASLAVADLLIGACMFVVILQQLRGHGPLLQSGILGEAYHVIRQAALYVSLLSLMLITVDRWWSIHRPFSYRARRRKRNAAVAVGTVWFLSFAIHIVPVIIWEVYSASNCEAVADLTTESATITPMRPRAASTNSIFFSTPNVFTQEDQNTTIPVNEANITFLLSPSSFAPKSFLSNRSSNAHSKLPFDQRIFDSDRYSNTSQYPIPIQSISHQFTSPKLRSKLPLYEGLPGYNTSALVSLAWDVQYLIPLVAMLTLNCSLYVGILGRKRVQIRRSLTSFNRLSSSFTDRRNSVSSMPNFYIEVSSSLDENAELLLSGGKSKDTDSGGGDIGNTTKNNTKFNFYTSTTTTYKQLQQHYHQTRPTSSSTLRSSVSMPHVHLSSVDQAANPNENKTLTTVFNNNNNTSCLHPTSIVVAPLRRFSWAPRKSSLALSRRSKGSEELAKDLLVRQDRKAACWLGLLVVVSLACWLPHTILRVLRALDAVEIPAWVLDTAIWVQLANSSINPMLYGFFNKEIRQAFKQWMRGGSRRKRTKFKNALLLYGVNINAGGGGQAPSVRRMSLFGTLHE
ncbi:muscarinic acetylcholine receptor [Elysia marginata]|uniref:Muscarinic acetylcholine receptor n=1 Tax=Elysia marginata TaxID=1093978 RepID=A0AAV4IWY6_9GAST|nr:muscarinic acetylcholine receptor [Elysia marginata]